MKLKKIRSLKLKKIPFYLFLLLLTLGASLIIGFLSFTGMFALAPFLGLAIGAFILSVAYEGEIYLKNIKGAFHKLFKSNYLKNQLAKDYLFHQFENDTINSKDLNCPQFFKDYEAALNLLHKFEHKRLDKKSKKVKRKIEKSLKDMEKWFALQLFSENEESTIRTPYEQELRDWLKQSKQDEAKALLKKRRTTYRWVLAFSAVSGIFMGIATTYLLVEAFTILPILAAIPFTFLPAMIIPLALIAGLAYTFLIYNAITDMIHNDTLRKWYYKIRDDFKKGVTWRNLLIAASAVTLVTLAIVLTLFTVGTWWTIAKHARPLFSWMSKIPSFIMGVVNPIILGVSQSIFNLENTCESLEMIYDALNSTGNFVKKLGKGIREAFYDMWDNENWLQMVNPFRILIKLIVIPLRLLLFLGHLVSIGVTADQVPGVSKKFSAGAGFLSELFEDLHFFVGDLFPHTHHHHNTKDLLAERLGEGHGHDHSADIPSRCLTFLFKYIIPLYAAAAAWDYAASRLVTRTPEACGLINASEEEALSFEQLNPTLQGKNAIVLHKDELYYANRRTQKIKKIRLKDSNQVQYNDLKLTMGNNHRLATDEELEFISTLTGRHSSDTTISWERAWDKQRGKPPRESVTVKPTAAQPSNDWQLEQTLHRIDRYLEKHKSLNAESATELRNLRQGLQEMQEPNEPLLKERINQEAAKLVYARQGFFATSPRDFLTELPERISYVATAA